MMVMVLLLVLLLFGCIVVYGCVVVVDFVIGRVVRVGGCGVVDVWGCC